MNTPPRKFSWEDEVLLRMLRTPPDRKKPKKTPACKRSEVLYVTTPSVKDGGSVTLELTQHQEPIVADGAGTNSKEP